MRTIAAAVLLAASCALAGCGVNDPLADQDFPGNAPAVTSSSAAEIPHEAEQTAARYATAARGFTPDTMRRNYDLQLQLSAGDLHGALAEAGAPTKLEIQAQREFRARTTATVLETVADEISPDRVKLQIRLRERAVTADAIQQLETTNVATVERRGGAWKVTAFTAQP